MVFLHRNENEFYARFVKFGDISGAFVQNLYAASTFRDPHNFYPFILDNLFSFKRNKRAHTRTKNYFFTNKHDNIETIISLSLNFPKRLHSRINRHNEIPCLSLLLRFSQKLTARNSKGKDEFRSRVSSDPLSSRSLSAGSREFFEARPRCW